MTTNRKLAAIMFADIVGYTATMQSNEEAAIVQVKTLETLLEQFVETHDGEVIQYYGDGCLTIFGSATSAIECAMAIQQQCHAGNGIPLRIGIHIGEIRQEDGRVLGDGVNLASRIESIGKPGTVLFSHNVYQKIRNNSTFKCISLGLFEFKNVKVPMEVFSIGNEGFPSIRRSEVKGKLKPASSSSGFFSQITKWFSPPTSGKEASSDQDRQSPIFSKKELLTPTAKSPNPATKSQLKSIAVLPFDSLTVDDNQQYLAEGIANEIRSQLLSIHDLKVISRASSKYYKEKLMTLKSMGEELNVGYILDGTVQQSNDKIKVGVQLSNSLTDEIEWTLKPYEHELSDVFSLENEIAKKIVSELKIELSVEEEIQLNKIPTTNAAAYEYFKRGKEILYRGKGKAEELNEAIGFFNKATSLDTKFSRAYTGISEAYLAFIFWGLAKPIDIFDKAFEPAVKALELDDTNGESYAILGAIKLYRSDINSAHMDLKKAAKLSPNFIETYDSLAWVSVLNGEKEEALNFFKTACALDPLSSKHKGNIGHYYYSFHEFSEGVEVFNALVEKQPNNNWHKWMLGYLQAGAGDYLGAINTFESRSVSSKTNWMLGYAYGMSNRIEDAEEVLRIQLKKRETTNVPSYMIATIYIGLGNKEKAIEWLELDSQEGGSWPLSACLTNDIKFKPIWDDPRYQAILISRTK